ncbi:MAG: inositol monophosphatase [candidate division KSB1 bacterium]|nr:inositol monophosphatase [candidate division KSB1 bacterium]
MFSEELQLAVAAAKRAGAILRRGFTAAYQTQVKSDRSLVTEFDRRAEEAVREMLADSPYSILGEEQGLHDLRTDRIWVIDPLDGTTNFVRRMPLFVVSIGLLESGKPILGVVYDPLHDECFYAETGVGAFKNGKRLLLDEAFPKQPLLFLECGVGARDKQLMAEQTRRLVVDYQVRLLGATALELCRLVDGSADAYISSGDHLWDFAAGLCLATEAGGAVCDWRGRPWHAGHSFLLVGKKKVVEELSRRIGDLQPDDDQLDAAESV